MQDIEVAREHIMQAMHDMVLYLSPANIQVRPGTDGQFMDSPSSIPDPASTFDDSDDFLGHLLCEPSSATAPTGFFAGRIQDPHDRLSPSLS